MPKPYRFANDELMRKCIRQLLNEETESTILQDLRNQGYHAPLTLEVWAYLPDVERPICQERGEIWTHDKYASEIKNRLRNPNSAS